MGPSSLQREGLSWIREKENLNVLNLLDKYVRDNFCPSQKKITLLKKFQCVDIKSEVAFFIWNCELEVMVKRKASNKISNFEIAQG